MSTCERRNIAWSKQGDEILCDPFFAFAEHHSGKQGCGIGEPKRGYVERLCALGKILSVSLEIGYEPWPGSLVG